MPLDIKIKELEQPRELSVGDDFNRAYVRTFRATTNIKRIGPLTILRYLATDPDIDLLIYIGTPYRLTDDGTTHGQVLEEDKFVFCNGIKVACASEDGLDWLVTATFGPWKPRTENPLDQP